MVAAIRRLLTMRALALTLSAAAVLLLLGVWVTRQPSKRLPAISSPEVDELVQKGSLGLILYDDSVESGHQLRPGDPINAGDRVRFVLHARRSGYVMVIGVDETRSVYLYYPPSGPAVWHGERGVLILPGAIELDAAPGREWFIALSCPEPFGFKHVRSELSPISIDDLDRWQMYGPPHLMSECEQAFFFLEKVNKR